MPRILRNDPIPQPERPINFDELFPDPPPRPIPPEPEQPYQPHFVRVGAFDRYQHAGLNVNAGADVHAITEAEMPNQGHAVAKNKPPKDGMLKFTVKEKLPRPKKEW